jgi:serralysin
MKSRFISDLQDPLIDLNTGGNDTNFFPAFFFPAVGHGGGSPSASAPPVILPTLFPIVPAEAVQAQSAQNGSGGPGSVVAETSGTGITINLEFDAAAMAAPQSFRTGIEQAASTLSQTITDKITINIGIDYSGTGGGAAAGPDNGLFESYSTVRADLVNNATKGDPTFNALPTGSTTQGQSQVAVWNAQLKLFRLISPNDTTTDDSSATFATDINSNLLVGVALHELTHALGRVPYGSQPDIFDFYRFTSVGTQLFANGNTAPAAYFSVDGGLTKIADYGQTSDPSDFLNSGVQGGNDPFNEFYTGSTIQGLTTADLEQINALGFHLASPLTTTVQTDTNSIGSTSLVQFFSNYYLQNPTTGAGPELKYGGAPVTAGEFTAAGGGTWTLIGAALTASGYEVAWKVAGADQYTVWNLDSSGNYLTNSVLPTSGSSFAIENIESSFHQDLNGDGMIGVPPATVIEAFGSTELVQVGSNYFLDPVAGGTGPELKFGGSPVVTGEFTAAGGGTWTLIGAEQTAGGYEVAWKVAGADQYTVWNLDSSGNYLTNLILPTSGTNPAIEIAETSFHQDLNGDGVIGIPSATIVESFGSTSLVQVGSNYFLDSNSTGLGPELKYNGSPVVAGEFTAAGGGTWTLIGAEQTASGYEVAWKVAGVDLYTVWNLDNNGNYVTNSILPTSGASLAIESIETSFHQDLNGDGVIGVPTATSPVATAAAQAVSVAVASRDSFMFGTGGDTGDGANTAGATTIQLDAFASGAGDRFASFFHDAQPGPSQAQFQAANAGHASLTDHGNHDGALTTSFHLTDPHFGHFIIS